MVDQQPLMDKGKTLVVTIQKESYPPSIPTRLVVAPSFHRIREILPHQQGTLLTKEWAREVQEHAVKGPHLKIGILYYECCDFNKIMRAYKQQQKYQANVSKGPISAAADVVKEGLDSIKAIYE